MKRTLTLLTILFSLSSVWANGNTTITEIGSGWFEIPIVGTSTVGRVIVPQNINGKAVTKLEDFAFFGCDKITDVDIPSTATDRYGVSAFGKCKSIRSIRLPDGMTELGTYMFEDCENLQNISFPNTLKKIAQFSFFNCTSLQSITLPSTVTNIQDAAFSGCTALQLIELPQDLTCLGASSFVDCTDLQSVTMHGNIAKIGSRAFYNCIALKNVTVEGPVPELINKSPEQKASWSEVFENVPKETLCITYPAAYATGWQKVVSELGCRGQVADPGDLPDIVPEDPSITLTAEEEGKIIQEVQNVLGSFSGTITLRGSAENVRASFALGVLPRIEAGGIAVFAQPSLSITAFNPQTETIIVRALPGQGGRIDPDSRIRPGLLKVYGSASLAALSSGTKLTVNQEQSDRAGEATLKVNLINHATGQSSYFLRVNAEL